MLCAFTYLLWYGLLEHERTWGLYSSNELSELASPVTQTLKDLNVDIATCKRGFVKIRIGGEEFSESYKLSDDFYRKSPCLGTLTVEASQERGVRLNGREFRLSTKGVEEEFKSIEKNSRQQEFFEMAERIKIIHRNIDEDRAKEARWQAELEIQKKKVAATWQ